jgi:hypothetical protein
MDSTTAPTSYREENPGDEKRRIKLLKKLGLKGVEYPLCVLESLKKSDKNKEHSGGWKEVKIGSAYFLDILNPPHVNVAFDHDEFERLMKK